MRKATEYKLDSYAEALRGYPWPMFIAVAVDSFMDGLLVGIAMIAGDKAGLMMAFALVRAACAHPRHWLYHHAVTCIAYAGH